MKIEPIEPGATYHIYNRGNNGQDAFFDAKNYKFFIRKMTSYLPVIGEVYAYCLMRNHYHIVLRIKEKNELPEKYQKNPSQVISNLLNSYVKLINLTTHRTGSLFEKTFERKRITTEAYLKKVVLYVHLNPEKHKVTDSFLDYPYSSAHHYKEESSFFINTDYIFNEFGGKENFWFVHKNKAYQKDTTSEIEDPD